MARVMIKLKQGPNEENRFNVQILKKGPDERYSYSGEGQYCKDRSEVNAYITQFKENHPDDEILFDDARPAEEKTFRKTSDGSFDFYYNSYTGEKKIKLDPGDMEVNDLGWIIGCVDFDKGYQAISVEAEPDTEIDDDIEI